MEIETTICIDMNVLANELEDQMREMAEEVINSNDNSFQDDDDVQAMIEDAGILDAGDVQNLINETMMDVADNTDTVNELATEHYALILECQDMRNEVEKLRRSMRILLEERNTSIKQRVIRAYGAGSKAVNSMARKVHWHMPRR